MNKRLFKFSVVDFILLLILSIIIFVGFTGILSLIMGRSFISFVENQWITLAIFALITPTTQALINRRGELIISDREYLSKCNNHLDEIILSRGYISNRKSDNETIYTSRTKIGRFFNFFFNENIQVRNEEGVIRILSKKTVLIQLESKIKKIVY